MSEESTKVDNSQGRPVKHQAQDFTPGSLDGALVPMLEIPRRCFNAIVEIVNAKELYPNDQELGAKVRQIINAYEFTT